jgi:hypothetical protein
MNPILMQQYTSMLGSLQASNVASAAGDSATAQAANQEAQATLSTITSTKIADKLRDHNAVVATQNQQLFTQGSNGQPT